MHACGMIRPVCSGLPDSSVGRALTLYRDSGDLGLNPSLVHHCFTYNDPILQLVLCQLLELTG